MTITAVPTVKDGCLMLRGKVVLTRVPGNVTVTSVGTGSAFLGATSTVPSSRHVFNLGFLLGYKLLCLFRVKMWWMIPRVGRSASDIPMETQLLLLEAREECAFEGDFSSDSEETAPDNTFYILFLPVLDGQFRSTLQGTPSNELQFCIESGDAKVQTSKSLEAVFVNSGDNPFELIKDSIKILEKHKGTFSHLESKKIPAHLDWFGWCTWDAFYTDVSPQGIKEGLQSLANGGFSPKFIIIDDGWQETFNEFHKEGEPIIEGTQFTTRLKDIKENKKFTNASSDNSCDSLHNFIGSIKQNISVKYVYMWHALAGYWGGVLPSSDAMKKHNPKLAYPIQSPGNTGNLRDIAMDMLEKYGVGIIDPPKLFDFYHEYHSYLASCGVDGVKVDVQNLIETLGSGYGGRVSLTKRYQEALEQSVARNFKDNNLICCMSHNSDSIYSSKKSAVARASEDFMPRESTFQTLHIASVAFNSLLLGEIFVPDWDMFHSKHETAEFHAAARAIGGCAVYVSDKPGNHDFKILKKLVLPDRSVLRARHAGRPTRDCLFEDPVMDGKSLLKIWNLNILTGVLGVFNCQGAGSWPMKSLEGTPSRIRISGKVRPLDVEFLEDIAGENWNGDCVVYAFNAGLLSKVPSNGKLEMSLETLQCEIFTVSPIRVFGHGVQIAPIGLLDMYNSGGAVEALDCIMDVTQCMIKIKGRGCGRFGAYSNVRPKCCVVDMKEEEFSYNPEDGLLAIKLGGEGNVRDIEFIFLVIDKAKPLGHFIWFHFLIQILAGFKSLTMAESCLLFSPTSLFYSKTKPSFFSPPYKPLTLQFSCLNSLSLSLRTHPSPFLTFVAQTSGWAQQGEDNTATAEEDGLSESEASLSGWETNAQDTEIGGGDDHEEAFVEPPEDAKLFVGNLPYDVDSQRLAMLFEQAGTVEIAEVIYNRETDQSRGFGFVTMSTVKEAETAVEKLNRYEFDGRLLTVNKASPRGVRPERTPRNFESSSVAAYVGNLPWDVDNSRLEQIFSEHGKVVSARIVYDRETGRSRGFGFVSMSDEKELNDAIAALDGQSLDGRTIRVSVAEDRPRRGSF
ncbi:hypothetical protein RJT34_13049 [Clitoria ternatea]|uniref:galactinol--sucrose galactosyltransferase n=1 Tax=Clitoria ternatea TaxID=43366 RepID=A0AAN9JNB2_CLITE